MKETMKKKLLICFKPIVIDPEGIDAIHVDHFGVSIPTCLTVPNDQNKKTSSTIKSSFLGSTTKNIPCHHQGRKKSYKALPRVVRAIFDISMRTRVRDRNLYQLALQSKSNCARKSGKRFDMLDNKPVNQKLVEANSGNSGMRSVFSSSSVTSFSMSTSEIGDNGISHNTTSTSKRIMRSCPYKYGVFYLIVVTLVSTIFMGRVYAVIFTILWLYFIPFRRLENTEKLADKKASKGVQEESHNGMFAG